MLRWIVGSSLKFRYLVVALAAALMFFGIQQLGNTEVDVFPEFAPPKVEVQTTALGLSANEVEELVTSPSSRRSTASQGLDEIRSKSVRVAVVGRADLRAGHRSAEARQLVAERIAQVSPPAADVGRAPRS